MAEPLSTSFMENEPSHGSLTSLVSPLQRKALKNRTPKTAKAKSMRPVSPMRLQELGPRGAEPGAGKSSDKFIEKNVEALQRRTRQLEDERELLRTRLSSVEEEKLTWAREREDLVARYDRRLRELEAEKSEIEGKHQADEQERQDQEASEERRLRELRKEKNEAKQEAQSLQARLTRAEDYLRVSKELSHALQLDKQRQSEEAQARVQALEAHHAALLLASDSAKEAARADAQALVVRAQKQLEEAQAAREQIERQLFQALLLALKLEGALHPGRSLNRLDGEQLWADIQRQGLPVAEWGSFLAMRIEATQRIEVPQSLRRGRGDTAVDEERPAKRPRRGEVYAQAKI